MNISTYKCSLWNQIWLDMLCQCWNICVLMCVVLVKAESLSGKLPPPENLNLFWDQNSQFLTAHWSKPADLEAECKINYRVKLYYDKCPPNSDNIADNRQTVELRYTHIISNDKEICLLISTNPMTCGNKESSEEAYKSLSSPPAIVKDFNCIYYSNKKMNCTWLLVSHTSDIQLFYRKVSEDEGRLTPCSLYITNGSTKTGCHLHDEIQPSDNLQFIINGNEKGRLIKNSFIICTKKTMKPLPPTLKIKKEGQYLYFISSLPDFAPRCWKFRYKYSRCSEEKEEVGNNSTLCLDYDAACKYTVRVQFVHNEYCDKGESDMSEPEFYGENSDPTWPIKVAVIVIPAVVSVCLIVTLVLFRRYIDLFFPEIPDPSLLFKDILKGNDGFSKSRGAGQFYVPVKDIVARDVRLEPKSAHLYSNGTSVM